MQVTPGDFSALVRDYRHRPGYSPLVLRNLKCHVAENADAVRVADVGSGTGKLTENLLELGLQCMAVEPNDAMREEGARAVRSQRVSWHSGSGESTGLDSGSIDWVLMGSSFHWTDPKKSLPEIHRILRPGGYFTALWNPRDFSRSEFHAELERKVTESIPELSSVSCGPGKFSLNFEDRLLKTGLFEDVIFVEARYEIVMSIERFLGTWRSVNYTQALSGPERWSEILYMIKQYCSGLSEVVVPYKTRSFTARRVDLQ